MSNLVARDSSFVNIRLVGAPEVEIIFGSEISVVGNVNTVGDTVGGSDCGRGDDAVGYGSGIAGDYDLLAFRATASDLNVIVATGRGCEVGSDPRIIRPEWLAVVPRGLTNCINRIRNPGTGAVVNSENFNFGENTWNVNQE